MRTIVAATRNAGKLREIRELTRGSPWDWRSLDDLPELPEPEETGATFAENARLKAVYYSVRTGLAALADDSGLEVDALGGAPGVHSARFAGAPRSDARNVEKLLNLLGDRPLPQRTARFRCVMALAIGARVVNETSGVLEGSIAMRPRGVGGFGYDPVFLVPELGLTVAELAPAEKNARSHRGQALRAMLARLSDALDA